MPGQVHLTKRAYLDLEEIWDHLAPKNPTAAERLVRQLTGKFALLCAHPRIGRQRDELLLGLRSFALKDYLIFYQLCPDGIEILRVLHSARDIEAEFDRFLDSL